MSTPAEWPPAPAMGWARETLGAPIVASQRLVGGLTAAMFRLTPAGRGLDDVVLRLWPPESPYAAEGVRREAAGLTALADAALPAPRLIAADPTGEAVGAPASLTTAVPGQVDLAPVDFEGWLRQLAEVLVQIHRVPVQLEPCWRNDVDPANLDWIADPGLVRDAVAAAAEIDQPLVLSHGDFQHFNVLWDAGQLSGVVDWTDVGMDARGRDVGHCRLNLAVLYSAEAAEQFRCYYEAESGVRIDVAADVREILEFNHQWPRFIPRQVAGRSPVDTAGMADRVRRLLRTALAA